MSWNNPNKSATTITTQAKTPSGETWDQDIVTYDASLPQTWEIQIANLPKSTTAFVNSTRH